jgi:hypothetical protein
MSTYTPIATQTLTSTAAVITFANIPQGYTDLILQVNDRLSQDSGMGIYFNQTGYNSLYSQCALVGGSGTTSSGRQTSQFSIHNNLVFGDVKTANTFSPHIIQIGSYSNPSVNKAILWRWGIPSGAAGGSGDTGLLVGNWRSTEEIKSINIFAWNANYNDARFEIGTSATLYGIAARGGLGSKATGGTVTTSGGYTIHTFTQSGLFVPTEALTVDYLIVGGGGAGGHAYGGGGGGGGFRTSIGGTPLTLTANTQYPAIVGAGGVGGYNTWGGSGQNSSFASITAIGGGGGGGNSDNGLAGGSGGGGGGNTTTAGTGNPFSRSPAEGTSGGTGAVNSGGGGGGGAGSSGSSAVGGSGGNGGAGASSSISGSSVTYAGGGAGAGYVGGSNPVGGTGGGGNGTISGGGNAGNGTANLGGGGGSPHNGANSAGNGGSGVVIIRYTT